MEVCDQSHQMKKVMIEGLFSINLKPNIGSTLHSNMCLSTEKRTPVRQLTIDYIPYSTAVLVDYPLRCSCRE